VPILGEPTIYRASEYWRMNLSGGVLAGIGATLLLLIVFGVGLWMTGLAGEIVIWFAGICVNFVAMVLLFFPGNLVAMYPLEVEVEPSKQIVLIAPWKRLAIPVEDLRDIRDSFLHQGYVVRLNRRYGLLKSFTVPWFFGQDRTALGEAIESIVSRRMTQPDH